MWTNRTSVAGLRPWHPAGQARSLGSERERGFPRRVTAAKDRDADGGDGEVNSRTRIARHYVSTDEAATDAGVSVETLLQWTHAHLVTPAKRTLTGHYRWDLEDLRRQLSEHWPEDYGGAPGGRGPLS